MQAKRINNIVSEELDTCARPRENLVYQTCIVYVPEAELAVVADGMFVNRYRIPDVKRLKDRLTPDGHTHDPVNKRYTVLLGEEAEGFFEKVLKENPKTSPEDIDVSSNFVCWARLMYQVSQIPDDVASTLR